MKLVLLFLLAIVACGPAIQTRAAGDAAYTVLAKGISNDGSAWEPWRRTAEQAPRPAYILLTDARRACLVDPSTFDRVLVGDAVPCQWRYPRSS